MEKNTEEMYEELIEGMRQVRNLPGEYQLREFLQNLRHDGFREGMRRALNLENESMTDLRRLAYKLGVERASQILGGKKSLLQAIYESLAT